MNLSDEKEVPDGVRRVLSVLDQTQTPYQLQSFETTAHHANEAAHLLGCPLGAIVKSLVFQADSTGEMALVLVSGENRADIDLLRHLISRPVRPAAPGAVHRATGYSVGAVPPFGLKGEYRTIIDADLMAYEQVWGSAGSVRILLGITPQDLQKLTRGHVERIKCIPEEK